MSSETDAPSQTEEPLTTWQKVVRELKEWAATLAIVAPAFLLFTGLVYEQRVIPSESMVPTLEVGDRVAVAKFAYGYGRYSLPLSLGRYLPLGHGRFFPSLPERGDVVVFEHTHSDRVMIKRVIGLPGDTVQMLNETLIINGEPVDSEYLRTVRYVPDKEVVIDQAEEWRETIGDKSWITHRGLRGRPVSDSLLFIVPEGHLFMVGDNRNNSYDSRELSGHCPPVNGVVDRAGCPLRGDPNDASVGFVPLDHLIGRADTVLLTFHRCKLQDDASCRKRVWQPL
ncbi:signal peptidase I [Hyphomonas sp.]|jgi:signal peptidase I|uniref:signal peptidase I n=1 Tax=Hyphomonas sp. TaxID=87 RepID=UPI0025BEB899|nr:signal peptidase I [Hyphomonas sp.]MBI1401488.1 signal peptidase I [Hyphomonas sp.]